MRILLIADPRIPVPPLHYGGAERIVHLYASEFSRLGHAVHLIAGPGSQSYGGRLHLHREPSTSYLSRARRKIQFQFQSLWAANDCDVVYNHGRIDYLEALFKFKCPILNRFPNPLSQSQVDFAEARIIENTCFHCMSENQINSLTIKTPTVIIPNPIDCSSYSPGLHDDGYLVFLGRLTRNKGVDIAIDVALQTGKRLVIAGNISNEDGGKEFFRDHVEPFLDGDQIRWIGLVDDVQKQSLLSGAEALLFPIRWEEPFGIVMVEALACGCPVIATRRASTPEVIDHGLTGFLCEPKEPYPDAFVEAVKQLHQIDRAVCRLIAEQRFDVRIVTPRILDVLSGLANYQVLS